ncbi:hypothetical protein CDV36_011526 [Fusarium kuroshium]|uniref:Uncharacterized protein n=1 Tax=Fusarium kuroshium TaxID=2010991 RepID=A0A3M2RUB4_9HYPO|nr:hypothetical protein CDV36_011526 [Fusarium kuroshium]
MAQNTADQPSTEAAKPNTGGESPQAPTKPRVDPIAEAKLLELYYDFISELTKIRIIRYNRLTQQDGYNR